MQNIFSMQAGSYTKLTPSFNMPKKGLDRSHSPSPPLTEHSSPQPPNPSPPPAYHPLTVTIFICNRTPCYVCVASAGPL